MNNIQPNDKLRLARLEAICNQLRSEMDDIVQNAYNQAVADKDEERAADLARKIRNRMLDKTDAYMSLDRMGIDTSSTTAFLKSLRNMLDNSWAVYRQHLRDITAQEGFPFNIDWGTSPSIAENETEEEDI